MSNAPQSRSHPNTRQKRLSWGVYILIILGLLAISITIVIVKPYLFPTNLRQWADKRGLRIGAAIGISYMQDKLYVPTLVQNFNTITTENALKFGPLSPARGQYNFDEADAIVKFAQDHKIKIRGHTLVWTNQLPEWLTQGTWSRDELITILHDHIGTVVGRYKGIIYAWDVVNEAFDPQGSLAENNFWMQGIGPDYVEMALCWAHEADPGTLLFINESYAEDMGAKSNGVYNLVASLKSKGTPIDGVGMEMHTGVGWPIKYDEMAANMQRLAGLGLQVQITEMDVRIQEPATSDDLAQQAKVYADVLHVCVSAPNCSAFVMWGLTDAHSWISYTYPGLDSALIFDKAYQPKPAYYAILDVLKGK